MTWIHVTAVPNPDHLDSAPRSRMLLNTDRLVGIAQAPDDHTQIWMDWDPEHASLAVVESIDEVAAQMGVHGRRPRLTCCSIHDYQHSDAGQRARGLLERSFGTNGNPPPAPSAADPWLSR